MPRMPKFALIDGFLSASDHAALLVHALHSEPRFAPATIVSDASQGYEAASRIAWYCRDGLGPVETAFRTAVSARLPEILAGIGMKPFALEKLELELAAHPDGSHFTPHIDTMTKNRRALDSSDRVVTMVYYFHAQPRRFRGGELAIYPFDRSAPVEVEPLDNRLLAFPAICLHEVRQVQADPDFAAARFAVNCWLHRART